jgi:uncharacterized protein HemY
MPTKSTLNHGDYTEARKRAIRKQKKKKQASCCSAVAHAAADEIAGTARTAAKAIETSANVTKAMGAKTFKKGASLYDAQRTDTKKDGSRRQVADLTKVSKSPLPPNPEHNNRLTHTHIPLG